MDRLLRAHKQNPDKLTVLDRLAIVGKSGMGALTYYPEKKIDEQYGDVDLDELAEQCRKILNTPIDWMNYIVSVVQVVEPDPKL